MINKTLQRWIWALQNYISKLELEKKTLTGYNHERNT